MSAGANDVGESRRRGFVRNEAKHAFAYTHSDTETHTGVFSDPMLPEWAALAHPDQSSTIIGGHCQPGRETSWATHAAWGGAGLYFFRARYYDPLTGRWLSNDPIGISGGLNQYAFCANNPVMFVDPEGLNSLAGDARNIWNNGHSVASGSAVVALVVGVQINVTPGGIDILPVRGVAAGVAVGGDRAVASDNPEGTRSLNVGFGPAGVTQVFSGIVGSGTLIGYGFSVSWGAWLGAWETRSGSGYGKHYSWCDIIESKPFQFLIDILGAAGNVSIRRW